jgi:CO dehydrogenase/acetyl-CoA synthase complex epsilon subunit
MIKKTKRPILIVGHEAADSKDTQILEMTIRLAKIGKIPLVAKAHVVGKALEKGLQPTPSMPVLDIGNRLIDPNWKGLYDEGQYDLAMLLGIPYCMEWVTFSSLKHYGHGLKAINLDRYYHPHARLGRLPTYQRKRGVRILKS